MDDKVTIAFVTYLTHELLIVLVLSVEIKHTGGYAFNADPMSSFFNAIFNILLMHRYRHAFLLCNELAFSFEHICE